MKNHLITSKNINHPSFLQHSSIWFCSSVFSATIIQHSSNNLKHPSSGNVSMPGLLRDGYQGANKIDIGHIQKGQVSHPSNTPRSGSYGLPVSPLTLCFPPLWLWFLSGCCLFSYANFKILNSKIEYLIYLFLPMNMSFIK